MRRSVAPFLIALAAACSDSVSPTLHHAVDLSSAIAWSGATISLRSRGFTGSDSTPLVTVGADTLVVRHTDDSTIAITLPDSNGSIRAIVHWSRGTADTTPALRVFGFAGWQQGPTIHGMPMAWPATGAEPTILVLVDSTFGVLDASSGVVQPLARNADPQGNCLNGPVPAVEFGLVVTASFVGVDCQPPVAAPMPGITATPDTAPPLIYDDWPVIQMGRGRWLISRKNYFSLIWRVSGAWDTVANFITDLEPHGFSVSPRRDRVVPIGPNVSGNIPVFDPSAPNPVYHLPSIGGNDAAAFTPGGDTLFVSGDAGGNPVLLALDATTGATLNQLNWPAFAGAASLVVDSAAPFLYAVRVVPDTLYAQVPEIQVVDRHSFAVVATLRLPHGALPYTPDPNESALAVLTIDAHQRMLYLLLTAYGPQVVHLLRYELP